MKKKIRHQLEYKGGIFTYYTDDNRAIPSARNLDIVGIRDKRHNEYMSDFYIRQVELGGNRILHSFNGEPAIKYPGATYWFKDGVRHREGGLPAYIDADTKYWYENGALHRTEGPAVESSFYGDWWYYKGYRVLKTGPLNFLDTLLGVENLLSRLILESIDPTYPTLSNMERLGMISTETYPPGAPNNVITTHDS